jgi:hypothetical protein
MTHERRRRLVVDPRLQYELISPFLLVFVPATAVFCGITWAVLHDVEGLAQAVGMTLEHPFVQRLAQLRVAAIASMVATCAGVVALTIYGGLVRSRRIAGPIVALRAQLERAARGESCAEVQTRSGDHLAELQSEVNRLLAERRTPLAPDYRTALK